MLGEASLGISDQGVESTITPVPFGEMVKQFYRERSGGEEIDTKVLGSGFNVRSGGVFAAVYLSKGFFPDRVHSKGRFFGVDSPSVELIGPDPMVLSLGSFDVYDMDPEQLKDPGVLDDLKSITPWDLMVAPHQDAASRIGSWAFDPVLREHIIKYGKGWGRDGEGLEKYVQLRESAVGKGGYLYSKIVELAKDPNKHIFTQEDLEWLQTFMRNKGIPIPGET